jgi:hypothetical protein
MKKALVALVLAGCGGADEPTTVRLCNDTGHDINAVAWNTIYSSDSLSIGACTDYETPTADVYRYTRVSFRVQTDDFLIQPIDFVGETPLGGGAWSYHLTITDYASRSASVSATPD